MNGKLDTDEATIDCGGACTGACPTCTDKKKNGDEAWTDCGGSCPKSKQCEGERKCFKSLLQPTDIVWFATPT